MSRRLLWCVAFAALPLPARADQAVTAAETVIRLTVQPMSAPKPALRYLLLPELKEITSGNPIPNYLKCLLDQDFASDRDVLGSSALRLADRAARMDRPDWQILPNLKTDGISLLVPDVQKIRALAAALQERFRAEVAQHRFDDALVTAKTMFAMARHTSEHPTLIGDLVGIAVAYVAIAPLEEMLEQPGCPNLYWALTNLPNPLVPLDRGLEGERLWLLAEFPGLSASAPLSADQLHKLIALMDKLLRQAMIKPEGGLREWLDARTKDEELLRAARRRLVELGLPEERVLQFPAAQVLLLDEQRSYEVYRDEGMKLMNLPAWQIEALTRHPTLPRQSSLFDEFVPAVQKVRRAQARLEQRLGLLRHVEALRLYAAENDGRLPQKLEDILMPLPADPFTGKPFHYQVDGATVHLRGSPPPGMEKEPAYNVHYEVTLQK